MAQQSISDIASTVANGIRSIDSGKMASVTANLLITNGNAHNLIQGAFGARAWVETRAAMGREVPSTLMASVTALMGHATALAVKLGEMGPRGLATPKQSPVVTPQQVQTTTRNGGGINR